MSELKPCPFCGGEADVIDYDDECWVAHQCANGTSVEINSYDTEAEAIAAWNSRAERTCRDTGENEWHFVCSACGYEQNGYECWNYCPNCGARVVE